MPINLWVTIITILAVSSILISNTNISAQNSSHSIHMTTSMTVGMLVSIIGGIILGAIYNNDLYLSTLLSMGIGIISGGLSGISTGFSSTYEGLLSGLMGGMMGAMVGKMISIHEAEMLIELSTLLYTFLALGIVFVLRQTAHKQRWYDKYPIPILILLFVYFIIYHQLGAIIPSK